MPASRVNYEGRTEGAGLGQRNLRPACWLRVALGIAISGTLSLCAQQEAASVAKARTLIATGDFTAARATLEAEIKTDPHASEAHFLLGYVLYRQQDPTRSLAEYTLGASGRRPTPSEFRTIGADYVLLKDFADADRWFTEATLDDPRDPSGWYLLGRSKYSEGKYADAVTTYRHLLTIDPEDVKAEDNLGLSYQALNEVSEAKAAFERAIALQQGRPSLSGAPYLDLGELWLQQGQPAKAAEYLRGAVLLSARNPKAHEQLAVALKQTGDLPGARVEFEKAAALAPKASPVHFELGQIYRRLGLKEEARHELDLCSQLAATHSAEEVPNFDGSPDVVDPLRDSRPN